MKSFYMSFVQGNQLRATLLFIVNSLVR